MEYPYRPYRKLITRFVVGLYFLVLLLRACSFNLPGQICRPVLIETGYDLSYWLIRILRVDWWLTQNLTAGILFSIALFVLCMPMFLFPRKRIFFIIFSILFFVLFAVSNIYLTHSQHYLALLVISSFVFFGRSDKTFSMLWEGLRYYLCFLFASAFFLKIYNGGVFQWDLGYIVFREQMASYLFLHPNSWLTLHFYSFFLEHPNFVNIGQKMTFLFEGIFAIGFFTKKYDGLLMFSAFFIFITTMLFSDVFFIEQLLISFLILISPKQWHQIAQFFKRIGGGKPNKMYHKDNTSAIFKSSS